MCNMTTFSFLYRCCTMYKKQSRYFIPKWYMQRIFHMPSTEYQKKLENIFLLQINLFLIQKSSINDFNFQRFHEEAPDLTLAATAYSNLMGNIINIDASVYHLLLWYLQFILKSVVNNFNGEDAAAVTICQTFIDKKPDLQVLWQHWKQFFDTKTTKYLIK